jgi:hypothetical protein
MTRRTRLAMNASDTTKGMELGLITFGLLVVIWLLR